MRGGERVRGERGEGEERGKGEKEEERWGERRGIENGEGVY